MRTLTLSLLVLAMGCEQPPKVKKERHIPVWKLRAEEVFKFQDGGNTCYVYWGNRVGGISCVEAR